MLKEKEIEYKIKLEEELRKKLQEEEISWNLPIRSLKRYTSQNDLNPQEQEELKNLEHPFEIKKQEIEKSEKISQKKRAFLQWQQEEN